MDPVDELTEMERHIWLTYLVRYTNNYNHRGPHVWRRVVDPTNPKGRIIGCSKCGKRKPGAE